MHNRHRALLMIVSIMLFVTPVQGQWSSDPASPMVLGDVLGFGSEHTVVSTPDGATWVAWIDHQCFASLVVQRIGADGTGLTTGALVLDTQDDCVSLTPQLEAFPDNTVIASAIGSDPVSTPVHRIDANGQELWTPGVVADDGFSGSVHTVHSIPGGDALIAGQSDSSIQVGRYSVDGTRIWNPPATFATGTGSNLRIFALVTDDANGAYVLWDAPGAYTRRVYAMRVAANGTPAWAQPLLMVDIPPGSSRHTDPVAVADGLGGLVLVWTQGAEQSTTPVPLRLQRLLSGGTLLFDAAGLLVSTLSTRQYDVQVRQHAASSDFYVAWRDGPFDNQMIRAQRLTLNGQRVWGDTGKLVTPIAGPASAFSLDWLDEESLGIAVTNTPVNSQMPRVTVHHVSTTGQVTGPWPISGTIPAGSVASASLDGALAVVWQRDGSNNSNEVVTQRINVDGTLGLVDSDGDGIPDVADNCSAVTNANQIDSDTDGIGNVCDPDFNNDCTVNFFDYSEMTAEFLSTTSPVHDLNSDGTINFNDIWIFQQFFLLPPGPSGLSDDCEP